MNKILYNGFARLYLQGRNALHPVSQDLSANEYITYHIGDTKTDLVLCDHRPKTVAIARQIFLTHYQNGFAKHFNQFAKVEVICDESMQHIKINLHESHLHPEDCPVLWLGVLENNKIPGYQVEWEIFRKLSPTQTAFVALIL